MTQLSGALVHDTSVSRAWHLAQAVVPLLLLYIGLDWYLLSVGRLPSDSYYSPVLLVELLRNLPLHFYIALPVLVAAALYLRGGSAFAVRWQQLAHHRVVLPLVAASVVLLAWAFSTYRFNFYFGQAHALDRVLLVVLAALVIWRPIFTLPFTLVFLPVIGQFDFPIGGYSWSEPFMLWRILVLVVAALLLQIATGRKQKALVFIILCLVAAHYWGPGVGKLRLNWLTHGHLYHLMFATYANGMWGFLSPEALTSMARFASRFDLLLLLFTLAVEIGALISLWNRRIFVAASFGRILLHVGIALFSGIFFWKWIVISTLLIWLLRRPDRIEDDALFTPAHFLFSIVLIGGGIVWFQPTNLAWYDSPLSYTYRLEVQTADGTTEMLTPRAMQPYDYQFTLGNYFSYLVEAKQTVVVWGAVFERPLADALLSAETPADIYAIEEQMGNVPFNRAQAEQFDNFIRDYVTTLNERGRNDWWEWLKPPPQLITFDGADAYSGSQPITKVTVKQVTGFYDGTSWDEIRSRTVREIAIPVP